MSSFSVDESIVLEALSSPQRLKMLRILATQPAGYTDLMRMLGMTKQRDAGKFSYHLKKLLSAGLVQVNEKTRLYELSRKGEAVLQVLADLRKALSSPSMMIVRRSNHAVEPFDRNKIVDVLIREANIPSRLADKVAMLAEEKLRDLNIEYLTAPLIRELVNTILIDLQLEKYRHKLTRVGLPLYDLKQLITQASRSNTPHSILFKASESAVTEYTILESLPREVSDNHLSGLIHLEGIGSWPYGIYAKTYSIEAEEEDTLVNIMNDTMFIQAEINLTLDSLTKRNLERYSRFINLLKKLNLVSNKRISLTIEDNDAALINQLSKRHGTLYIQTTLQDSSIDALYSLLNSFQGRVSIIVGDGNYFSIGYLSSGAVYGVGCVNAARAAILADYDEKSFITYLRRGVENIARGFSKKLETLRDFWRGVDTFHFAVGLCGFPEALRRVSGGGNLIEFSSYVLDSISKALIRQSSGRMQLNLVSSISRHVAYRLASLDVTSFGARRVSELIDSKQEHYTTDALTVFKQVENRDDVVKLLRYFNGGVVIEREGRKRLISALLESGGAGVSLLVK